MDKFYINNSSLPYTTCARRYYLTVGKGLRQPPGGNKYTGIGLAFHELIAAAKVGESTAIKGLGFTPPADDSFLSKIPSMARAQVAQTAQKILDEHPEMFGPDTLRENWFEIPLADYPNGPVPTLCGTIDHIMLENDTVILTDYKTTSKPLDAELEASYSLTFQRWFYMIAAGLNDKLPDSYKDALANNRLKWRYIFVSYEKNDYVMQPAEYVDVSQLDAARVLLADKISLAQAIIADPSLAVPEGTMNGSCYSCPFKSICLAKSPEDTQRHIDNWYLGYKPYYPKHDDK